MDRVRDLPHTADIGFEVVAATPDRLFELAAEGLVRALDFSSASETTATVGPEAASEATRPMASKHEPERLERLRLSRPDLDRLLVAWLRELLHRATRERLRPAAVRVTVDRSAPGSPSLEAEVEWRRWSDEEAPAREIKGVTYHGLRVAERDGSWHADVYLDV